MFLYALFSGYTCIYKIPSDCAQRDDYVVLILFISTLFKVMDPFTFSIILNTNMLFVEYMYLPTMSTVQFSRRVTIPCRIACRGIPWTVQMSTKMSA